MRSPNVAHRRMLVDVYGGRMRKTRSWTHEEIDRAEFDRGTVVAIVSYLARLDEALA